MRAEGQSLHGNFKRIQTLNGADHSAHRAISFQPRNIHDHVWEGQELRQLFTSKRAGEMEQFNLRSRHSFERLQQRSKSNRPDIYNRMVDAWIFHTEDDLEDQITF